uniref:Uncharacterized protein n=1 Tax=Oryza brachyantha TaxID=4533 RepID=J3KX48_ORYBR
GDWGHLGGSRLIELVCIFLRVYSTDRSCFVFFFLTACKGNMTGNIMVLYFCCVLRSIFLTARMGKID